MSTTARFWTTTAKIRIVIGLGLAALTAGLIWFIVSQKGDTPIEVADGSITMSFRDKFRKDSGKKISATKAKHKAQTIEVLDSTGNVSLTVDVTNRTWTITSADKSVTIAKAAAAPGKDDEVSITATTGALVWDDDTKYHHDDLAHQFTPATLSVTGLADTALVCPSGKCSVRIHLKP